MRRLKKRPPSFGQRLRRKRRLRRLRDRRRPSCSVQQATAEGIRYIKEAGADQTVLQLKSLEAFAGGCQRQSHQDHHSF